MIEFKELQLNDKTWIDERLKQSNFRGAEYSFTSNFIWSNLYGIKRADYKGYYLISTDYKDKTYFVFPAGSGNISEVLTDLEEHAKSEGYPFLIQGITLENKKLMETLFPGKFEFMEVRDSFDYIYDFEALKTLKGKKYHSKRNHVNRFKENNWKFEPITEDNLHECILMNKEWCEQNDCGKDQSKRDEMCAVSIALKNFFELKLSGGLLRIDDKVVAYTVGERLNSDTLLVHIEKAFAGINGAYPTINQEFINYMGDHFGDFQYVNREDDAGSEGLRKAKLSYKPIILLEKYVARIKE